MKIGVPKELFPGERRVALVPALVPPLVKSGHSVHVEAAAGFSAGFTDDSYREKGAEIVPSRAALFASAEIVLQVRAAGAAGPAGASDLGLLRSGQIVIAGAEPLTDAASCRAVAAKGVTLFGMELVPRITRAQSMDILSSQALVAGYKAVLLAANETPRLFSMEMTAAGTLTPAKVFVIGAGVAGLKAIATAKRLGAVVYAYDVRAAVKEQVESLGGRFVTVEGAEGGEGAGGYAKEMTEEFYVRQRAKMAEVAKDAAAVITTAAIPGKKSPLLLTAEGVRGMAPGSCIVDLAAERGGNCELSRPDQRVVDNGVVILGPTNLPSEVATHASQMFGKNLVTFLGLLFDKGGKLQLDTNDEIVRETMVARGGEVVNARVRAILGLPALATAAAGTAS